MPRRMISCERVLPVEYMAARRCSGSLWINRWAPGAICHSWEGCMTETVFVGTRPLVRGYLPYLALVVGTLGLALSPMFVHWSGAPGPVAGFYRVSIAALVMALPVLARSRRAAGGQ